MRARALAKQLGCDLAIIDKRRPKANVSEVMHVIGDIEGRNCVIMDDMIDTAGTLVKAAEVLKERGAKKVYAYCTHPIFSGPAIERIAKGSALDEVVVTNTIPLSESAKGCTKIRQLSVAPLIAETIQRIAKGESVMSLFSEQDAVDTVGFPCGRMVLHQASFGRLVCSGTTPGLYSVHTPTSLFKQGTTGRGRPFSGANYELRRF